MNIETVNELIASLESAGELSIKERKYLELAKEFRICSASLDAAIKTGNVLADQNAQLAAENVGLNEQVRALAADNSALINSSVCTLQDGRPLHGFYASEWFIAKLKNGEYAALKALPEEYSYDYRTNDGTYYTKDWVVGWMQTPDTEYRPNVKTPATDRIVAGIKADAQSEVIEWLDAEITAIDTMYRGDPSYERDANWMKSEVLDVVELARKAFSAQLREGADK
ncbi:Uncharacterised protein [Raoultella ornithinolytica]|uniref:hypothetical protein n=1 Tax=Raoultella ornithinolytica TaxID=54291 RepID=UPI0007CCF91A|nr:Uncharacterised protein [Raoultella ornithinolytica]